MVVLEDFPEAFGREGRRKVVDVVVSGMRGLARAGIPCVVILTDAAHDANGSSSRDRDAAPVVMWPALQASLAREGLQFSHIAFNPLTPTMVRKALEGCAARHGFRVGSPGLQADVVQAIADGCGGDLRQAIHALQFACVGVKPEVAVRSAKPAPRKRTKVGAAGLAGKKEQGADKKWASRDPFLTLIHATGKVLYNKREEAPREALPPNARPPLEATSMAPEAVVGMAGVDSGRLVAFLHENMHEFFDDVGDAAFALRCLSDADVTSAQARNAAFGSGGTSGRAALDGDQLASLVSARGLMFANTHPRRSRFLQIRGPRAWGVEEQVRNAEGQLGSVARCLSAEVRMGLLGQGRAELCAQTFPSLRAMAKGAAAVAARRGGGDTLAHRLALGDVVLQPPDFHTSSGAPFTDHADLFPTGAVELAELAADRVGQPGAAAHHAPVDADDAIQEDLSD